MTTSAAIYDWACKTIPGRISIKLRSSVLSIAMFQLHLMCNRGMMDSSCRTAGSGPHLFSIRNTRSDLIHSQMSAAAVRQCRCLGCEEEVSVKRRKDIASRHT